MSREKSLLVVVQTSALVSAEGGGILFSGTSPESPCSVVSSLSDFEVLDSCALKDRSPEMASRAKFLMSEDGYKFLGASPSSLQPHCKARAERSRLFGARCASRLPSAGLSICLAECASADIAPRRRRRLRPRRRRRGGRSLRAPVPRAPRTPSPTPTLAPTLRARLRSLATPPAQTKTPYTMFRTSTKNYCDILVLVETLTYFIQSSTHGFENLCDFEYITESVLMKFETWIDTPFKLF
ncbi:Protein of unknown function [Gryllus bimaculatus]|nr:Protein of unknown function [Gryllus bimaculatus]